MDGLLGTADQLEDRLSGWLDSQCSILHSGRARSPSECEWERQLGYRKILAFRVRDTWVEVLTLLLSALAV